MALFPEAWLNELLSKSDIVSIISQYTQLSAKGRRLWGLCPMHGEKTPSFSVSPDKQMFYCFGCHAGGTVIQFLMDVERLSFSDAVKQLAERAHMELPEQMNDETLMRERATRDKLYDICKQAALYFCRQLMSNDGAAARAYLKRRGVGMDTVKRFGLGYAKPGWDNLLKHLRELGYSDEDIMLSGLAIKSSKGNGCYDAYRDRVIFPIIATNGKVLGFGARTMGDDTPKYLNTGDTPIFNKRHNLYALNMLKGKQIADVVMVEGYMDAISLHARGVQNAVASLGTALTQEQARLIKRFTDVVYICYDGDNAGINAALRGMDILSAAGMKVRIIRIPDDKDPDDYVREFGKEGFEALKDNALTMPQFKLWHMKSGHDFDTPDGRESYATKACAYIGTLTPVERDRYYEMVAQTTGINIEALKEQGSAVKQAEKNSFASFRHTREKQPQIQTSRRVRAESELIALMTMDGATAREIAAKSAELFSISAYVDFSAKIARAWETEDKPNLSLLMAEFSGEEAENVAQAVARLEQYQDNTGAAKDCIMVIEQEKTAESLRRLTKEMDDETTTPQRRIELLRLIKELKMSSNTNK